MVIFDEAVHSSEMETMMFIMENVQMVRECRVHSVFIGYSPQLGRVFLSAHNSVLFLSKNRDFDLPYRMTRQFESLFSRLHGTARFKMFRFRHHYSTHPQIDHIVLSFMYREILIYPIAI